MNHASIANSIGDLETAEASYTEALAIARTFTGSETSADSATTAESYLITTLEHLASHFEEAGEYEQCEQRAKESLALRQKLGDAYRHWDAIDLVQVASCVARLGRLDEAQALHAEAVAVYKPKAEPHDEFLATSYRRMGKALLDQGRAEAALEQFEKALEVRLWSQNSGRYDIAITQHRYAKALRSLGRDAEAREAEAAAETILEDSDYYREVSSRFYGVDFNWAESPIRIHVESLKRTHHPRYRQLRGATRKAITAWADVVEPGLPAFEFVESPSKANITIKWVESQGKEGWLGVTKSTVGLQGQMRKARIQVATRRLGAAPEMEELYRVILHEMGHALGLLGHSPYPGDVMYFTTHDEGSSELTERDRATLQMIY